MNSPQRKKDGKAQKIWSPKSTKGKKLSLPRSGDRSEPSKKSWAEIPKSCQRLGIPGMCSTTEVGLRQLKGSTKKAQRTKDRHVLLKHLVMQ